MDSLVAAHFDLSYLNHRLFLAPKSSGNFARSCSCSGDILLIDSRSSRSLTCCPRKLDRLSAGFPARRIRALPHATLAAPPSISRFPTARFSARVGVAKTKRPAHLATCWALCSGDVLLSHGLSPYYHRGCSVSLPCSEWERVVPLRYCHQSRRALALLGSGGGGQHW